MKKWLLMAMAVVLTGCGLMPIRSRVDYESLRSDKKTEFLKETTGLTLEKTELEFYAVAAAPMEFKQYYQPQNLTQGDNINLLFKKEDLLPGDILLRVNDLAAMNNVNIASHLDSLEDKAMLTFLNPKNKELKVYEVLDKGILSQLTFSSETKKVAVVRVKTVVPGSQGDAKGFKEGDYLIQGLLFNGQFYQYFAFSSIPTYRASAYKETLIFDDVEKAAVVLLKVFEDKQSLLGTEKITLMIESQLTLSIVRGDQFMFSYIHRIRGLGVGVKFYCPAGFSCGKVLPRIMTVYQNSDGARAGFQEEDLILEIDGTPVKTSVEAIEKIRSLPLGKEINFKVTRGLKIIIIKAAKGLVVIE